MNDDVYFGEPVAEQASEQVQEQAVERETAEEQDRASFERRLISVQRKLKAPKNQWNSFGKYAYRNCEDIFEGLKPLLEEYDLLLVINNEIVYIEGYFYVKATASVRDPSTGREISAVAYAREPNNKKGMDESQVTGTASSYANKRALGNLFAIDDTKDSDTEQPKQKNPQAPKEPPAQGAFLAQCANCGTQYQFTDRDYYISWSKNPNPPCCSNPQWMVL